MTPPPPVFWPSVRLRCSVFLCSVVRWVFSWHIPKGPPIQLVVLDIEVHLGKPFWFQYFVFATFLTAFQTEQPLQPILTVFGASGAATAEQLTPTIFPGAGGKLSFTATNVRSVITQGRI